MKYWGQFYFPEANSEMALRLFNYHDLTMVVVIIVMVLVLSFLLIFLFSNYFLGVSMDVKFKKCEYLECVWTVTPGFILFFLGFLSLRNLYSMEVGEKVEFSVKVVGHQWYWEYCYQVSFSEKSSSFEYSDYLWEWLSDSSTGKQLLSGFLGLESYVSSLMSENSGLMDILNSFMSNTLQQCHEMGWSSDLSYNYDSLGKVLVNSENMDSGLSYALEYAVKESGMKSESSLLFGVASLFMNGDWFYKYDSFLVPESLLDSPGKLLGANFRNQDVSIPCYLPVNSKNEVLVSTADVMHSWGVPELGVKADAVPGRVNVLKVVPAYSGMVTGFCYELCGVGHSQMPIEVLVLESDDVDWVIKSGVLSSEVVLNGFSSLEYPFN